MSRSGYGVLLLRQVLRFLFLIGCCACMAWAGGGWSFVRKPIPVFYLAIWVVWGMLLALLRGPGVRSVYDRGQVFFLWISGVLVYPAVLIGGPWEYSRWSGPIPRDGVLAWVGVGLCVVGLVLQILALLSLRGMYTVRLGLQPGHRLVTTGPYRYIRHPGYASALLCLVGMGFAMSSFIAFASTVVICLPLIIWRIEQEEKMLRSEFGDRYARYQSCTRRLLPLVY